MLQTLSPTAAASEPGPKIRPPKPPKPHHGKDWATVVEERVSSSFERDAAWHTSASRALRYYRSDMYRSTPKEHDLRRARFSANFIRTDIDGIVAPLIDADLTIRPIARFPRWYPQAKAIFQFLDYTKESEEEYSENIERAIMGCFQIGEGVVYEGWDQYENEGLGMPASRRLDARRVLCDPYARKLQKDDADWVISVEQESVQEIKRQYGVKNVMAENWEKYMTTYQANRFSSQGWMRRNSDDDEDRAWLVRMWHKHLTMRTVFVRPDGQPAVFIENGDQFDMTEAMYDELPPERQDEFRKIHLQEWQLWECVVVNEKVIEHSLSPFDKSRGRSRPLSIRFLLLRGRRRRHARFGTDLVPHPDLRHS